eukprot:4251117-Pyramimonas_sp.AAC.1
MKHGNTFERELYRTNCCGLSDVRDGVHGTPMKGRPHASCVCLSPCALNTLSAQAHHGVVISTLDDLFVPRCPAGTTGSFSQKMYASLL